MLEQFEAKVAERLRILESFQDAATRILGHHDEKINILADAQIRAEQAWNEKFNILADGQIRAQQEMAELRQLMDRFLRARTDGHN